MSQVSVIIMEQGSAWPGHVLGLENIVVGGAPDELPDRARDRIGAIERSGRLIRIAVLACSGAPDFAGIARRADIARELMRAVTGTGFGRLLISAGERATIRERTDLLCLAEFLRQAERGTMVTVSVRFGVGEPVTWRVRASHLRDLADTPVRGFRNAG